MPVRGYAKDKNPKIMCFQCVNVQCVGIDVKPIPTTKVRLFSHLLAEKVHNRSNACFF